MTPSSHKTKIVCTIGPSCDSLPLIEKMIKSGMNVARINFSHGDFSEHQKIIALIRQAANQLNLPVITLIDLLGVKMRIGNLKEPIALKKGDKATFTTKNVLGTISSIPVSYKKLPES